MTFSSHASSISLHRRIYAAHITGLNQYTENIIYPSGFHRLSKRFKCAFSCAMTHSLSSAVSIDGRYILGANTPRMNGVSMSSHIYTLPSSFKDTPVFV